MSRTCRTCGEWGLSPLWRRHRPMPRRTGYKSMHRSPSSIRTVCSETRAARAARNWYQHRPARCRFLRIPITSFSFAPAIPPDWPCFSTAVAPAGMPTPVSAPHCSARPCHLLIETFKSVGANHPGTRFGQYTTAFDDTQIVFFNIARHVEQPELWFDPDELVLAGFEWTIRARTYMLLTALQNWHYRFYLAKGTGHTVIADDKFYVEKKARKACRWSTGSTT